MLDDVLYQAARRFPRGVHIAVIVASVALFWPCIVSPQQPGSDVQQYKAELEVQKLELEIAKLEKGGAWLPAFIGLLAVGMSAGAGFWVASRTRTGTLDQAVHEKRLDCYPKLVSATSPLAIYFPKLDDSGYSSINPHDCTIMGTQMSKWYFETGGMLLSKEARDAYFRLARALTLASSQSALEVPTFPEDARDICKETIDEYSDRLKDDKLDLENVETWQFGRSVLKEGESDISPSLKFKDFIFLQQQSSRLRSALSEDLRSRRRPK